ncbi:MAG: hypothetical protein ACK5P6_08950 [Pseudobdellovibrionaceae bacterium]|jgi:hypothetical protein
MSSSVTASDRNRHTEELKNAREEYQSREAEQAKKQKRELTRMQQKHDEEIDQLTEAYKSQLGSMKNASSEQLKKREENYQAQIQKLRSMHTEQLRRKVMEQEEMKRANTEAYESEIAKNKQINEQQKNLLKSNFDNSLAERDRTVRDLGERNRDTITKSMENQKKRLNEKHSAEIEAISEDRDLRIGTSERNAKLTRNTLENRIKEQERLNRQNLDRVNSNWESIYNENQKSHNAVMNSRDEMLKGERRRMSDRFEKATTDKLEELQNAYNYLKDQTAERLDREVRTASVNSRQAQNDRIIDMITNRRIRNIERDNLVEEYEKRMDVVNEQRDKTQAVAMEMAHGRVDKILEKTDKLISDVNQDNRMKQNVKDMQHRQDRDQLVTQAKASEEHLRNKSQERIEKVMTVTNKSQINQEKLHRNNLDQLRTNYQENLVSQREAHLDSLKETYTRMDERLRSNESKFESKLRETVNNYESKLEQMEELKRSDLKRQKDAHEARMSQLQKAHQGDQVGQNQKFELKMSQLEETHKKDIERLERRHHEQMSSLASRVNASKRS